MVGFKPVSPLLYRLDGYPFAFEILGSRPLTHASLPGWIRRLHRLVAD